MVLACVQASGTTAPPPPRTLEHIVGDAAYVVVGVPQRTKYLGYDTRIPEDYGREFAESAPGRILVYEVSLKRVLYPQDSSLPKSVLLGVSARAGSDATRMKLGEEHVFFFSRYSKGQMQGRRVIYMIQDPPVDRGREKDVSKLVLERVYKERDRK